MFIPLQGEITIEVDNQKTSFGLGHMLYLPPNTRHSFFSSEKSGERLIAMVDAKAFSPHFDSQKLKKLPLNQFIKELLFYLLLHPKSKNAKALVEVFIQTLTEVIIESSSFDSLNFDHLSGKVMDQRVKESLEFMHANLAEAMNMDIIAKKAGLSSRNFNRLFLKETGLQPKQCLIQLRIEKAKELLMLPRASVTEVAFAVGYSSLGQFISAFRSRTGQLPSEFLRYGQKQNINGE